MSKQVFKISVKPGMKTIEKMIADQLDLLEETMIRERFESRKAITNNKLHSQLAMTQAKIQIGREFLDFLYEVKEELEKEGQSNAK